jgi:nicotinamide-nucleotide amidase
MTATPAIMPADLLERYRRAGKTIAAAESCTGGMIAAALTDIAGSSDVFERGFVTYSNEAKTELIGVPAALIRRLGAVSGEVAQAMAEGALAHSHADMAVSVTGIAGPGGGTPTKPVGLVWFGLATRGHGTAVEKHQFAGDRASIRRQAVDIALLLLERALSP